VSLKLGRKAGKDHPGDHVAADVNSSKSTDTSNKRRWVVINSDLGIGVASHSCASSRANAREVPLCIVVRIFRTLVVVTLELVDHEGVVSVLEDRDVLKLFQEEGDIGSREKESSKEHEGDNQHRSQGNSQLLV
jgi:hypothetical protein